MRTAFKRILFYFQSYHSSSHYYVHVKNPSNQRLIHQNNPNPSPALLLHSVCSWRTETNLFTSYQQYTASNTRVVLRKETRERRSWQKRERKQDGKKEERKEGREGERWKRENKSRGKKEINLIHHV